MAFKITFSLDAQDSKYFQDLYKAAKANAKQEDAPRVMSEVRALISRVRSATKVPNFVSEAITTLEDLMQMLEDKDYALPQKIAESAIAGLAYFANPQDAIPDHIPALGFLDDAIMISFVAQEFRHELWGFRKFRALRDSSEQRPWAGPASERLKQRLVADRKRIRGQIEEREAREATKKKASNYFGW